MKSRTYLNVIAFTIASSGAYGRSVFLNGVDISSAKIQQLKKVDLKIDDKGDIYIVAPQYQVHEENTFVPLSAGRVRLPVHQNEPFQFQKEGNAPGVVPQFMHGTDKTAKTTDKAGAINDKAPEKKDIPPAANTNGTNKPVELDSKKSDTNPPTN